VPYFLLFEGSIYDHGQSRIISGINRDQVLALKSGNLHYFASFYLQNYNFAGPIQPPACKRSTKADADANGTVSYNPIYF